MKEADNIIRILEKTKKAVKDEDVVELKHLSDQTIHTASISQDTDNIAVAVIVYSLSKLIQRKHYHKLKNWNKFFKDYVACIDKAIRALKKNNLTLFRKNIACIRKEMMGVSGNLKKNIHDVFRKASINKASRIYEHGISMEQTAKLLGISIWELTEYAGQTGISDASLNVTIPVQQRVKLAEEMFK